MADRGKNESPHGGTAEKRRADPADDAAITAGLPNLAGPFDFARILAVADALPIMIAFIGRDERYRFVNRALADWFERPRKDILGKRMSDMLGEEDYRARQPLLAAAFAGERQFFAA